VARSTRATAPGFCRYTPTIQHPSNDRQWRTGWPAVAPQRKLTLTAGGWRAVSGAWRAVSGGWRSVSGGWRRAVSKPTMPDRRTH